MKVFIVTLTDSVSGNSERSLVVEETWTVADVKKRVQETGDSYRREEHGSTLRTINGIHPNFQRLFFNGKELLGDKKCLKDCKIKDQDVLRFGVLHRVGAQLREGLKSLYQDEKYKEFSNREGSTQGRENVGDDKILQTALMDLKERYEVVTIKQNGNGQSALERIIFKANGDDFTKYSGVWAGGGISMPEHRGARPLWFVFHAGEWRQTFKTMNGIPIKFFRIDDFQLQANERPMHTNTREAAPDDGGDEGEEEEKGGGSKSSDRKLEHAEHQPSKRARVV